MKIIVCSPFQICSQYTQQEKDISTPSSDKIIIISIIIRLAALLYCVAPVVANSLQSGRFWARSTASVHDSP